MSAIEELYYGNISPCERFAKSTSEYKELSKKLLVLENDLLKHLSQTNKELFERILEIHGEQESISEKDAFIYGLRLGAQLAFEILSPYESQFE